MSNFKNKIKVLVVDDSAVIRSVLTEILSSDSRILVVGAAVDPYDAREQIKKYNPDVITLDIEMPRMNGIEFLKNLMRLRPMPVVMISTLTHDGAPATLEALSLGAVDFIGKPQDQGHGALEKYKETIIEKVVAASSANIIANEGQHAVAPQPQLNSVAKNGTLRPGFICAIGASTGGTEAIKDVIVSLPEDSPPVVVAQHIPAVFSTSFAQRVDKMSAMRVYEASHKQLIERGCVYIAPGDAHLKIKRQGSGYICLLDDGVPVNRHKPSVEVLFDSVTQEAGDSSMGIILTGMGADGAEALLRMRQRGAATVAQDENSSVVWGMPGSAVKLGAAEKVLALSQIPKYIITKGFQ